ncbi:UBP15 [Mytilus edulis]|uniref:ubiquitinyl hydrolase 1 n=1 Tax=Mytilus edulis TaxID=6550 RepID=A0A8S3U9X6_MYTED|nr:UBP15 [Mytilus edulis]
MSDTSEDEFEGFSAGEIELACQRYQVQLAQNGIGDDFLISDVESELSDDNNDEPQLVDVNNAGDAPNNDGWHQEFDIYERGLPHLFQPRNTTGPQNILGPEKDIIDFFQLFLSDHLLQQIIEKTDSYAKMQKDLNPDLHKSAWSCPSLPEMKAFIGLTFLMGIDVKPDLKSYWSKDCLETPYFATVLARDRFMQIMRYLHFTDPHQRVPQRGEPNYDSTYKVRYFMDALNQQMRDQYIPKRNVSIDECMIPYKGRVALKQYMPAKPTKWGIKLWALAESDTGYMSFCKIYQGKTDRTHVGLASTVVISCLEGANLSRQGYHVYMDNYFSSPELFTNLFENLDTGACGTVRQNRRGLPQDLMTKKPVGITQRGDSQFRQKGAISATVWKDKKNVSVISTIHDNSLTEVSRIVQQEGQFQRQQLQCPKMVADYTSHMGGVDVVTSTYSTISSVTKQINGQRECSSRCWKLLSLMLTWCKFDDDVVSRCTKSEGIDNNFGGQDEEMNVKHCTNAYMLVYIRESVKDDLLVSVSEKDIPDCLIERLAEERRLEAQKRKERTEAHLYMNIQVVTDDNFNGHQGNDLFDGDKINFRNFKVKKSSTVLEFMHMLADNMKYPVTQIRPWPFQFRQNQTYRPTLLDLEANLNKTVLDVADNENPWTVFVETLNPESGLKELPQFDKDSDVLIFLKLYDPKRKTISFCGHTYVPITAKTAELLPDLCRRAGFPVGTPLLLFEEVKPNMVERIESHDLPIEKSLEELMDGDIIVFQKDGLDIHQYDLPTARDYFKDLYYRVEVIFCDKAIPNDPGFSLDLSLRMNYEQMANAVATYLQTDPYLLQFFKPQSYREGPGNPIRCTYEGNLKDLLLYAKPRQPRKLYYQQLNIKINELENKKQFKCTWVTSKLKEEKELVLYPSKNGKVTDLFDEAKKQVELEPDGSDKLRLLEVISNKIYSIQKEETLLDAINMSGSTKTYRIEEIPKEEVTLKDNETLIPVAHFHKAPLSTNSSKLVISRRQVYSTFGVPFLLKIKQGEKFSTVKERIQKKLEITEKDFEKYKFAIVVMGKVEYISDEENDVQVDLSLFKPHPMQGASMQARPWLGLDHVNKTPKRSKVPYSEKAIKIHN